MAATVARRPKGASSNGQAPDGGRGKVKPDNTPRGVSEGKVAREVEKRAKEKPMNYVGTLCVSRQAKAEWEITDPLNAIRAMLLLGYEIAEEGTAIFKDLEGNQIKMTKNATNRPFKIGFAKRYMLDMLRKKWAMNAETIVIDEHGMVQSGQHRLVGLVLAQQELKKNPAKWAKYWPSEGGVPATVEIECLIFTGISSAPEVINTLDIGQKRTLADILYRDSRFPANMAPKKKALLANILAGATRLVWIRSQGKSVSDAPHYPHSEAMDFLEEHPEILSSVYHIWALQGGNAADGQNVSRYLSMPYAAGLHYLMATSATDSEEYQEKGPSVLNFALKDRADEFWTQFANGKLPEAHPIARLKKLLLSQEASSGMGRDEIVTMVVKAFNLYLDGKLKVQPDEVEAEMVENTETGRWKLNEDQRLGGLDVAEITVTKAPFAGPVEEPVQVGKRKHKSKWSKGDTAWHWGENGDHLFVKIEEVITKEGENGGLLMVHGVQEPETAYEVPGNELSLEKPEA